MIRTPDPILVVDPNHRTTGAGVIALLPPASTDVSSAVQSGRTALPLSPGCPGPLPMPNAGEGMRFTQPIGVAVAQVFGVDAAAIDAETRGRADVALARQVAMYLAHVACGMSLTDVGRMFSRDRTTVAHACAVIEDRRDDKVFDRAIELLEMVVAALVRFRTNRTHSPI